ncbi:Type II iodothyronine deiodinase [Tupaia chinensis]|uniref:Iodothyronine deiodinase n=1 Tax=Tupaia chinensis TaxID=246437 RepID=L9JL16_TUPCH|nr:Type II iodothyronine deiodinase [Tupaia chinensis]
MGILSVDLLITLQILPVFFSNCLFLALYDSVILLKHVVLLLSRSKSTRGEWRGGATSEGLRCVWKSFLLDAYKQLPAFSKLVEEFSSVADFLLVYIDEAHPSDGWAVPGDSSLSFEVKKHRNQEDRCAAAHQLLERFSLPPQCRVVADRMDNNANVAYGVAFERVCIVQRQKIAYLGGKGPFYYNLQEVRRWLEKNFSKR